MGDAEDPTENPETLPPNREAPCPTANDGGRSRAEASPRAGGRMNAGAGCRGWRAWPRLRGAWREGGDRDKRRNYERLMSPAPALAPGSVSSNCVVRPPISPPPISPPISPRDEWRVSG